jgi:hypothetical protein
MAHGTEMEPFAFHSVITGAIAWLVWERMT